MHQVHAVAGLRYLPDQAVTLARILDQAEQEEYTAAHETRDYRIVLPVHLQFLRRRDQEAAVIELPHAEHVAGNQHRHAHPAYLAPGPMQTGSDVMPQQDIADEAGNIVEERIWIPPAFAEDRAQDIPEPIEAERKCPQAQEEAFLPFPNLGQPRRNHRHDQVEPKHHIDEPEVRLAGNEIDTSLLDICPSLSPGEFTPGSGQECVKEKEHHERYAHTRETLIKESPCVRPDRHEKIGRCHQEQRHGHGPYESLDEHYAPTRQFRRKRERVIVRIDAFACMDQHNHKAGRRPQPVQKDYPLFLRHTIPLLHKNSYSWRILKE